MSGRGAERRRRAPRGAARAPPRTLQGPPGTRRPPRDQGDEPGIDHAPPSLLEPTTASPRPGRPWRARGAVRRTDAPLWPRLREPRHPARAARPVSEATGGTLGSDRGSPSTEFSWDSTTPDSEILEYPRDGPAFCSGGRAMVGSVSDPARLPAGAPRAPCGPRARRRDTARRGALRSGAGARPSLTAEPSPQRREIAPARYRPCGQRRPPCRWCGLAAALGACVTCPNSCPTGCAAVRFGAPPCDEQKKTARETLTFSGGSVLPRNL